MPGWIKLHRKLLKNPIFSSEKALKVWIWCLLKANHEPNDFYLGRQRIHLETGQFIMGKNTAKVELKMAIATIWFWLDRLSNVELCIERKPTNKYTVITVLNWNEYQDVEPNLERRRNADGTQTEPNKNDKNDKNINISVADQKSKPSGFRKLDDLLGKKQTGGAAYEWQDKAARMAKALNFKPGPSWFKLFKQAAAEGHTGLLDSTYSKIADLNPINPEKYFYKVYYAND